MNNDEEDHKFNSNNNDSNQFNEDNNTKIANQSEAIDNTLQQNESNKDISTIPIQVLSNEHSSMKFTIEEQVYPESNRSNQQQQQQQHDYISFNEQGGLSEDNNPNDDNQSKDNEENIKEEQHQTAFVESKKEELQRTNPLLFQECSDLISNIFDDYTKTHQKKYYVETDENKEETVNEPQVKIKEQEHIQSEPNKDTIPIDLKDKPLPSQDSRNINSYSSKTQSIITIQNKWRTYLNHNHLLLLKDKSFQIQRSFRKFLIKKYNLPDNFYYNDKFIKLQNDIYEENLKENLSVLFPALFIDKSDLNSLASNMLNFSNNPIHNPYDTGRINLFAKILDFDMMIESDESYETLWASVFDSIYSKCLKTNAPIQLIAVGGQHTVCVNNKGKIFSFGWNNYGQCGVPVNSTIINKEELNDDYLVEITKYNELKPKVINRVDGIKIPEIDMVIMSSSIACGEDHSLILDQDGAVWAFGLNLNGQLGLGHSRIIEKPTKITDLNKEVIVSVKTEGNINFAISNKGDAFMWPWSDKGDIQYSPRKLPLKTINEKVSSIACGNNFVLILNSLGLVYSMGRTNKFGQLGHGDYNARLYPSRIEFFINNSERITEISCGFKHSMAKSSTGRAYTWGLGVKGQLGQNSFNNYSIPIQVAFDVPFAKVYQISAGFRSSFFLLENRKIYCCGCNGTISMEKVPVPFLVLEKIPEMALEQNYSVLRIRNTWNKSFSLFYATIADTSTLKISPVKLSSILNQIAMRWEGETIEMPFIEAYSKYFGTNVIKKAKEKAIVNANIKEKQKEKERESNRV